MKKKALEPEFLLLLLALEMYQHAIQLSKSQQTTPTC